MAQCRECGVRGISAGYKYCYRCYIGRQNSNWHDPEYAIAKSLKSRDTAKGRSRFWVYVLETDCGHYVGHTANPSARIRAHEKNEVLSTAGSNPRKKWLSFPISSREDAIDFEAALKSYRDSENPKFLEMTGLSPIPFDLPRWKSKKAQVTPDYPRRNVRGDAIDRFRKENEEFESKGGCMVALGIIVAMIMVLYVVVFDSDESTGSADYRSLDEAEEHEEQLRLRREFYRIRDEILEQQQKQ